MRGSAALLVAALLVAALLGALLVGCVDSHVQTDPVPLARFCDSFFDALCEPLEGCGCGEDAVLACRDDQLGYCAGFPSPALVRSIDEGRLAYDGAAAAELFRRMSERECTSFVPAIDWRVRDLFTVGGVFTGTVTAGESCEVVGFELITECQLGACNGGVCQSVVGAGATCDSLHVCTDLDAPLDLELGLDGLSMRCAEGTCAPRIAVGGVCANDDECAAGACDGSCSVLADGASCSLSRECASANCDDSVCTPGDAPDGSPCTSGSGCASHVCTAGVCLPSGCQTF